MTVRTTRATMGLAAAALLSAGLLIVNTGAASAHTPGYHHSPSPTATASPTPSATTTAIAAPATIGGSQLLGVVGTPTKFSVSASIAGTFVVRYQTDGYPALTTSVDSTYLGVSGNGPGTTDTPSFTLTGGAHTIWCSEPDGFGTTYAYLVKVS